MKKAIVLTYAPVTKKEAELLINTDVFKIACNNYCAELKPNIRLCADDIVDKCLECDTCDVLSYNYGFDKDRVININYLPNKHSTLLFCVDWLYLKGYTDILLVASNPENTATFKINYNGINDIKNLLNLYKYTKNGNLDIPHITIKEFLSMEKLTDEEKLLGMTEPRKRTYFEKTIFTEACKFDVSTKGYKNNSIESGLTVFNILPGDERAKILNGEEVIEYNGMVIKRITALVPKEEKQEALQKKEISVSDMSYQEMINFVKEHQLKPDSNKKADLIKVIKEYTNG